MLASYTLYQFRYAHHYLKISIVTIYFLIVYYNYFPSYTLYYNELIKGQVGFEKLAGQINYRGESYLFATYLINKIEYPNKNYTIYYPNKALKESMKDVAMDNYSHDDDNMKYIIVDKYNKQFAKDEIKECDKFKVIENNLYFKIGNTLIYKCY